MKKAVKRVTLNPKPVSFLDLKATKPNYSNCPEFEELMVERIAKIPPRGGIEPFVIFMLRHHLLDKAKIDGKHGVIRPKEIADHNCFEQERATALKWYLALHQLFAFKAIQQFPVKKNSGRVMIGIPGCFYGFEIGGVLDFFNEQKIAVDIRACDVLNAGAEKSFIRLSERQSVLGSTVRFRSETSAEEYFVEKPLDIAIFRHPGPIFTPSEYHGWQKVFRAVLKTEPSMVIVSTDCYPIYQENVKKLAGKSAETELDEGNVFRQWLEKAGYIVPWNRETMVSDHGRLTRPKSIYRIPFVEKDKEISIDQYCDQLIFLAFRPWLFDGV